MIRLDLLDRAGLAEAQRVVSALHYLRRPVDARCSVEGYRLVLLQQPHKDARAFDEWNRLPIGYLIFGRPQATRCYPWYGDPEDVARGKVECSRWEVLNLARVWLDPSVQAGGALCNRDTLPGFVDRSGAWRSSLASTAIRMAVQRVRLDYLLSRPPCFPEQPYQLRWLLSYCDTRLHRGVVYGAAGFELYRGPGSDRETGTPIQTWRLPLAPLSPAEDRRVREASRLSERSRAYREERRAGEIQQMTIGGLTA